MYTLNIWNKFNLHWRKIALFFIVCITVSTNSNAQKTFNLPNYDEKELHFGFFLALNSNAFGVTQSKYFVQRKDTIAAVSAPWGGGAMLGFVVNARLTEYLDLRLLPGVSFTERELEYKFVNKSSVSHKYDITYVDIPLMLKYKSKRRGNMRMYMIGGGKFTIAATTKKQDTDVEQMKLNRFGFGVEYGVGIDIYNEMFKLAPEIRISHGFSDMSTPDQYFYSKTFQSLSLHTVTLYFNFE